MDDRALLVDGWVARALDPPRLALHQRRPLADIGPGWTVELDGGLGRYAVELATRQLTAPGVSLRLSSSAVDALTHAFEGSEARLAVAVAPDVSHARLHVTAHGPGGAVRDATLAGPCPADAGRDAINVIDGWWVHRPRGR